LALKVLAQILALVLAGATLTTTAASLVSQYFPMNDGDSRLYQDHANGTTFTTESFNRTTYQGHSVFAFNFHDAWQSVGAFGATATWYLGYSGGSVALYGMNNSFGDAPFSSPASFITETALANGGAYTVGSKLTWQGQTFDVTIRTSVQSLGVVTVPSGTYNNCKLVLVYVQPYIAGHKFQNYDSAAWVLAPNVGIIKDDVAIYDSTYSKFSFVDFLGNPLNYDELNTAS
jgi:hypothetical protein